jgi:hypothetical protein
MISLFLSLYGMRILLWAAGRYGIGRNRGVDLWDSDGVSCWLGVQARVVWHCGSIALRTLFKERFTT